MNPAWRSPALALVALALAWLAWELSGWLIGRFGLPVAALLQQAGLFILALGLLDHLATRFGPAAGDHDA
jgi:hypothetical protein